MGTRRRHATLRAAIKKDRGDHDRSSSVLTIEIWREREGGGRGERYNLFKMFWELCIHVCLSFFLAAFLVWKKYFYCNTTSYHWGGNRLINSVVLIKTSTIYNNKHLLNSLMSCCIFCLPVLLFVLFWRIFVLQLFLLFLSPRCLHVQSDVWCSCEDDYEVWVHLEALVRPKVNLFNLSNLCMGRCALRTANKALRITTGREVGVRVEVINLHPHPLLGSNYLSCSETLQHCIITLLPE